MEFALKQTASFSVRPDGIITVENFMALIPSDQKEELEQEINQLFELGWGEICFKIVNHGLAGYRVVFDVNFKKWRNE